MIMSSRLNPHEILQLVLFIVLLNLLNLFRILELILTQLLLEEMLQRQTELHVLTWNRNSQLWLALPLLGLLEVHALTLKQTVNFLRNELDPHLVIHSLLDKITKHNLIFTLIHPFFLDRLQHQIVLSHVFTLTDLTLPLLHQTWRLLVIFDKSSLLLLLKHRRLNEFLPPLLKTPNQNTLRSNRPQLLVEVTHIVDILGMTDIDLMRLP